jgi:hypothetical protein
MVFSLCTYQWALTHTPEYLTSNNLFSGSQNKKWHIKVPEILKVYFFDNFNGFFLLFRKPSESFAFPGGPCGTSCDCSAGPTLRSTEELWENFSSPEPTKELMFTSWFGKHSI